MKLGSVALNLARASRNIARCQAGAAPVFFGKVGAAQQRCPAPACFSTVSEADIDVDAVAYGFMGSQALFTALEIGLFDAIAAAGESGLVIEGVQAACQVAAPRLQTLVTALVGLKALRRDASSGAYTLSPNTAAYCVKSSRHFYGDYLSLQVGRQFYPSMGGLRAAVADGEATTYAEWFAGDASAAEAYTRAQHNGSVATAKALVRRLGPSLGLGDGTRRRMLDVGGGSGAFSYVLAGRDEHLEATVLELPNVAAASRSIAKEQTASVQARVQFKDLDVTAPAWPTKPESFDLVLISYVSGSVPAGALPSIYAQAHGALKPGGTFLVHDFMVDDALNGPPLAALWALQHVTVNADGLGLCPQLVKDRMVGAGFSASATAHMEMIGGLTKVVTATKAK